MKPSTLAAALLALSVVTTAFGASAEETQKGHHKFPMPAAAFKSKHEARITKARAKLEERIKTKSVDAEKAKLMRARFEGSVVRVNQAVAKVVADGTVTKDEAKEVRAAAKEARADAHREAHKKAQKKEAPKKDEPKKDEPKK